MGQIAAQELVTRLHAYKALMCLQATFSKIAVIFHMLTIVPLR